jgi:hypothetical protein
VRSVAVVLVVRYQDWWEGFLGIRLGIVFFILIVGIKQRLNSIGYEILRVKDVIETSNCLKFLLGYEVFFIINTHEYTQR